MFFFLNLHNLPKYNYNGIEKLKKEIHDNVKLKMIYCINSILLFVIIYVHTISVCYSAPFRL